ncbi:Far11p ASCRUDRAFT_10023 [Ascoidea rubescens DSM 1968]|uniref:Factor arrest protein 11 n=1 Tax=Ascoidea rubescens DSM 1968 TaxID=1344418 RepID=A0A1D2VAH9_9ASCO|nr:hypothetical protein ASCRUDRAFT_10023 [Ascoidea rubescens DSM 1968]ODV58682.1 hypothetical protein ASCRUDRAFT_10023 [Ascoidea rubescens DSM 1968]
MDKPEIGASNTRKNASSSSSSSVSSYVSPGPMLPSPSGSNLSARQFIVDSMDKLLLDPVIYNNNHNSLRNSDLNDVDSDDDNLSISNDNLEDTLFGDLQYQYDKGFDNSHNDPDLSDLNLSNLSIHDSNFLNENSDSIPIANALNFNIGNAPIFTNNHLNLHLTEDVQRQHLQKDDPYYHNIHMNINNDYKNKQQTANKTNANNLDNIDDIIDNTNIEHNDIINTIDSNIYEIVQNEINKNIDNHNSPLNSSPMIHSNHTQPDDSTNHDIDLDDNSMNYFNYNSQNNNQILDSPIRKIYHNNSIGGSNRGINEFDHINPFQQIPQNFLDPFNNNNYNPNNPNNPNNNPNNYNTYNNNYNNSNSLDPAFNFSTYNRNSTINFNSKIFFENFLTEFNDWFVHNDLHLNLPLIKNAFNNHLEFNNFINFSYQKKTSIINKLIKNLSLNNLSSNSINKTNNDYKNLNRNYNNINTNDNNTEPNLSINSPFSSVPQSASSNSSASSTGYKSFADYYFKSHNKDSSNFSSSSNSLIDDGGTIYKSNFNKELKLDSLSCLTYISMGNFAECFSTKQQIYQMKQNSKLLFNSNFLKILIIKIKKIIKIIKNFELPILPPTYNPNNLNLNSSDPIIKNYYQKLNDFKSILKFYFFYLTNFYFMLNCFIFEFYDHTSNKNKDFNKSDDDISDSDLDIIDEFDLSPERRNYHDNFINVISKSKILIYLVHFLEEFRWKHKSYYRMRNIILLINKLILIEFDVINFDKDLKKIKRYLNYKFGVKPEEEIINDYTKSKLYKPSKKHKYPELNKKPKKLFASPLDYYVFRQDLMARYPNIQPPKSEYPVQFDNGSSLSQYIETARTLNTQFFNNSLPTPVVHIATPAPSPSLSPSIPGLDGMNGGPKQKRTFQTNQSYPFIYPLEDELDSNVPYSIKEASEIFSKSVKFKLGIKQLWHERDNFMKQERGWVSKINRPKNPKPAEYVHNYEKDFENEIEQEPLKKSSDEADLDDDDDAHDMFDITDVEKEIKKFPGYKDQILSIHRIEEFFKTIFPSLNSLVSILIKVLLSNNNNNTFENKLLTQYLSYKQQEENSYDKMKNNFEHHIINHFYPDNSYNFNFNGMRPQTQKNQQQGPQNVQFDEKLFIDKVEFLRVKEVTLKSSTNILLLLTYLFKVSHILKFNYFTTLIFDLNFIPIVFEYLINENFKEKMLNKEVNVNKHSFWKVCEGLSEKRKMLVDQVNEKPRNTISISYNNGYNGLENVYENEIENEDELYDEITNCKDYYFYDNSLSPQIIDSNSSDGLDGSNLEKNHMMSHLDYGNPKNEYIKNRFDDSGRIFNHRYCLIISNLLKLLQKTIIGKTKRITILRDRQPSEFFRGILGSMYNKDIYKSILKIIKETIPYNGKKWKTISMDLISLCYLHLDLNLKDNWLTGKDIENEILNSEGQELAMRALVQFYISRKYEDGIDKLGYEKRDGDFFTRQMDLLSNCDNNE